MRLDKEAFAVFQAFADDVESMREKECTPFLEYERHMVFWELKAPQCNLVEVDDAATRYRPTKDLIKAETQLLHYVHQAAGDSDDRVPPSGVAG